MGSKARGEDHRLWVVYADVLEPLDYGGWPLETAFANFLDHLGFEPTWSQAPSATLELRRTYRGKVEISALTAHDTLTNPTYSAVLPSAVNPELVARERIMANVLTKGLYGWRGKIKYRFNMERNIADQQRRNPELFDSDGRRKLR